MPIRPADEQRLDAMYAQYGPSHQGDRRDYFALLHLTRKFGVEPEEIMHQVAFGGRDYGIDAYYIDRKAGNLYLFQFKWTEDHNQFRPTMERLAKDGLQRVFGATTQDGKANDVLHYLKHDLREARQAIDRVYLHLVFKGDAERVDNSEGLAHRREDLENKAHLVHEYFGRDVELIVEFVADRPVVPDPPPRPEHPMRVRAVSTTAHDGRTMRVGFIRLADLYAIYATLGQRFLDRNIRAALSPDNAPNRKLHAAFDRIIVKQTDAPSVFAFRHNGVTLAAERVTEGDGVLTLHAPRLLNGAQTVSTLARFLEQAEAATVVARSRKRLDEIEVLAKIVEADPASDFVTQVTISNNQQNPVPPWALRAMDRRQVDLADKFREEVKIFYSRQEGSFTGTSDADREAMGIESTKDLQIRPMAQTLLAVQGDLANMRELPSVFEDQRKYDATFRPMYQDADARHIVLAYKVGLMMSRTLRHLRDVLAKEHGDAVPDSRHLVWALLVQALLNDRKLGEYAAEYGTSLTREASFGEKLRSLTNARVAPLLRYLIAHADYAPRVAQGRYDFLKTNDAFRRAMAHAEERFGWSKQTF